MRVRGPGRWSAAIVAVASGMLALATALVPLPTGASEPPRPSAVRPSAVSSFEAFYNPFGDPWSGRTAANPSIPVALTPPCYRYGPKAGQADPVPEEIRFLSTSSSPLLFEECSFLFDATDGVGSQRQKAYVAALKAANPALKYLAFAEPSIANVALLPGPGPHPIGLADIEADQEKEKWYLHVNGQPEHRVRSSTTLSDVYLYDVTNPAFRAYMVQRVVASMAFHGVEGVVIEQCGDYPAFDPSTPPPAAILSPTGGWADGCVAFLDELKRAAPSNLVIFLGYSSLRAQVEGRSQVEQEQLSYDFYVRRANVSDGLFWEDPLGGVKASANNPPWFVDYLLARFRRVQDYAATRDNYVGVFVNTNAQNQSTFGSTNAQEQHAFADYYLAAYLAMFRGPKTPLVYYTPAPVGEQFRSAAHFSVWNVDVGGPLGAATQVGEARYQRDFSRARVFLNGSDGAWQVSLNDAHFTTVDGQLVTTATIQPRSGATFRRIDAAAGCASRPKVVVTTTPGPPGSLQVRVRAGLGPIQSIRFGQARSAVVDVPGGLTGAPGDFTHTPAAGVTELTFTIRRTSASGVTVPFFVTDLCGEWRTFAGGGPNAF